MVMRDEKGMPRKVEIAPRQAMYDAAPELLERGEWVCLNVDTPCTWPVHPQSFDFGGYCLWIIPITEEDHAGVAMRRPEGFSIEDAEGLISRFLSLLAWRERTGIQVIHRTGGNIPRMMSHGKKLGFVIRDNFDLSDLNWPGEQSPRFALALMREARSLNHHGYAFLSYWRVIELAFPKGAERTQWMNDTLPTLSGNGVKEALESITTQGVKDVGSHLYVSGRCAIAHASTSPIIDPDEPRDARRLFRELPLVRELAVRAIEDHFGIPTPSTEYQQHLYELRGWKDVLGADLVLRLLEGEHPNESETVDMPAVNIRLRETAPYGPMEGMTVSGLGVVGAGINVEYATSDSLFRVRFRLDLAEERLQFDVHNGLYGHDDGSVVAAEYRKEGLRFVRDYFLNGELQIWNAETGRLLSRKDSYLPLNWYPDVDGFNAQIEELEGEVERRRNGKPPETSRVLATPI